MKKNSTDSAPKTLHLSVLTISLMALFFFGLPVAGYFVFYKFIAPKLYKHNLIETTETKRSLLQKYTIAQEKLDTLTIDHQKIKDILQEERLQRAESEARATIAETAKTASGQQIASRETELIDLQKKIAFYEKLLKPKTKQEVLQCFNTSVKYSNGKIRYGVSFLKNNPKDRKKLAVKAKLRVVPATAQDTNNDNYPILSTRQFSLTKDYRLSGTLTTTVDTSIMNILDIKLHNSQNEVIAECWQTL